MLRMTWEANLRRSRGAFFKLQQESAPRCQFTQVAAPPTLSALACSDSGGNSTRTIEGFEKVWQVALIAGESRKVEPKAFYR